MTSQNSENGVPAQAGVQVTAIREAKNTFGSVEAQCGDRRESKEYVVKI